MNNETTAAAPRSPLTPNQIGVLMSPIHSSRVKSRSQGGRQMSYVEAYDIRATLIRLFGFGGFSITVDNYTVHQVDKVAKRQGDGHNFRATVSATTSLHIPSLGCSYREAASSSQTNPEPGEAIDFAVKTAASDGLKRCAANLGTQFGLSLYDNGTRNDIIQVLIDPAQAQALVEYQAANAERTAAQQAEAQARIDRATGQGGVPQDQVHPQEGQA